MKGALVAVEGELRPLGHLRDQHAALAGRRHPLLHRRHKHLLVLLVHPGYSGTMYLVYHNGGPDSSLLRALLSRGPDAKFPGCLASRLRLQCKTMGL